MRNKLIMVVVIAGLCPAVNASLSIGNTLGNISAAGGNTNQTTGISVQLGDQFVVTLASNKKGDSASYTSSILGSSTATLGPATLLKSDSSVNFTTWMWVYAVTGSGSVDHLTSANANQTGNIAHSVLHSSIGFVVVETSSILTMDGNTGVNDWTNSFSWAGTKDGILLEGASANDDISDYTAHNVLVDTGSDGKTQRLIQQYEFTGLSSIDTIFEVTQDANFKDASTVGAVFTEVIPEPGTLGLMGVAGLGIFLARNKRRTRAETIIRQLERRY